MNHEAIQINDYSWGYRAARVLHVANKLDLFSVLSGKELSLKELCTECKTKPELTDKLLIACAAMGLINKEGNLYKNSKAAEIYLVKGKKYYQGNIIAHSSWVRKFWEDLEDQISIEPLPDEGQSEHRDFIMGMDNIASIGRADMFVNNIDLNGRKKLLDIGGGPGSYSIAACKRFPKLKAVVYDLQETLEIAKEVIAREGLQERVSVKEGNWDTDSFGEGFDVILFSNVLHGKDSKANMKLMKAYSAMANNGLLVIQEFLLNDEKSGPLIPALFNIMVGAYSQRELLEEIEKAGFIQGKVITASEEIGCGWIIAEKQ